jgi:hypothetical protein
MWKEADFSIGRNLVITFDPRDLINAVLFYYCQWAAAAAAAGKSDQFWALALMPIFRENEPEQLA